MLNPWLKTFTTRTMIFAGTLCCVCGLSYAQGQSSPATIIKPSKQVKKAEYAAIDTENFELGLYGGSLSVEDFGTNQVTGLSLTYHINNQFTAQLNHGYSEVGRAAFEDALGGNFLSDSDKEFTYSNVALGYRAFYGRSFFGSRTKFNSMLYLTAGVENVEFAGETNTGVVLGTNYKIVLTDSLTGNIDLRSHIFNREFLSEDKLTQNIELTIGLSILF